MVPVFVINLDRAHERWAFMRAQAERLGIAIERYSAVTPDDIAEARFEALAVRWERPLIRTEVATLLSHAALWQRAIDAGRPILVVEDDAVLSPRLPAFLEIDVLPSFDLLNLEYFARRKFFRRKASPLGDGLHVTPVGREKAGAAAYVIAPEGARKALAALDRHAAPADAFLYAQGRLRVAQVEPALAIQAEVLAAKGIDPGIATATQIHEARERLPLTPRTFRFHARRASTQLKLLPFHIGRLDAYRFREPRVDLSEFVAEEPSAQSSS